MRMLRYLSVAGLATTAALAGGFYITIHSPGSPLGQTVQNAAVLVAVDGCAKPADARISGVAEGLVNGKRQSLKLEFTPTAKSGVFAVKKQWPGQGVWVLAITGTYFGHVRQQLVEIGPNGQYRAQPVKADANLAAEIEAALRAAAGRAT